LQKDSPEYDTPVDNSPVSGEKPGNRHQKKYSGEADKVIHGAFQPISSITAAANNGNIIS
jgi:hypothetical protein